MSRLILILSGDTFEIRTLCMSLEVEKFEIVRCSNTDQLWDNLTEGRPRPTALIADMRAPWEEMRSVFRRFRASERGRMTPVLPIADLNSISEKDTVESFGVNPQDFFAPPVDGVSLVRRIHDIPDEGEEPPEGFTAASKNIRGAVIGPGGVPQETFAPAPQARAAFPDEGSLQGVTPARLLTVLQREQATGRLEMELPDGRSELFIEKGRVMLLRTWGDISLGRLVSDLGLVDAAQVARLGDPRMVGLDQMIAVGVLGPHQAFDVMKAQLTRWLRAMASQRQGSYRWRRGEMPIDQPFPLDVPIHRTLLDGLLENPPVPHPLPPKLAQAVPTLTAAGRQILSELNLNAVESRLIKELDGHARVWNIVQQLAGDDYLRAAHLEALIIGLRDIGAVALRPAQARSSAFARPSIPKREGGGAKPEVPEKVESRADILRKEVERIKVADPFEVLKVAPDASMDDCRKVFFEMSKTYHPDKFYEEGPEIQALVEEIFKEIQDAYAILSDPEKREAFRKMRLAGADQPITVDDEKKAAIAARQGHMLLRNRNFAGAQELFDYATGMNPLDKDHKLYAIWSAHMNNPKDVVRNLQNLYKLINGGHDSAEAFYYFGVMCRANGDTDQAEKSFKRALNKQPGYLEPQRELRLIEMRRRKAEEVEEAERKKNAGFFGFKRS